MDENFVFAVRGTFTPTLDGIESLAGTLADKGIGNCEVQLTQDQYDELAPLLTSNPYTTARGITLTFKVV